MKTIINIITFVLLLSFFAIACKKEEYENNQPENKKNVIALNDTSSKNQDKVNNSREAKRLAVESSELGYIGNSQWQGSWHGCEIIFFGATDTQLKSGLNIMWQLVSAKDGDMYCNVSEFVPHTGWQITRFLAGIDLIKQMKVDWVENSTTRVLTYGYPSLAPCTTQFIISSNWTRKVSYFNILSTDGGTVNTFKISLVRVDDHLEMYSYTPINTNPGGDNPPL